MQLNELPRGTKAYINNVDWSAISEGEGHRLGALGVEEGMPVEVLHKGVLFWRDPIAVKIGRMTIAIRKSHAAAIKVTTDANGAAA